MLDELVLRGLEVRTETLLGRLDVTDVLADPGGRGEAVLEATFDHHAPARADAVPPGPRPDPDPYQRRAYLLARAGARHASRV